MDILGRSPEVVEGKVCSLQTGTDFTERKLAVCELRKEKNEGVLR